MGRERVYWLVEVDTKGEGAERGGEVVDSLVEFVG